MTNLWNREPALILGALSALLALGLAFGLNVTPMQIGAIMAAASAVIAVITRQTVTSPASLQDLTPKTLAAAQDAAQPVKDTIRKLPVWFLTGALGLGLSFTPACATAPPNLSPTAHAAFYQHQAQDAVDKVRDIAQAANAEIPPLIATALTRKITTWHSSTITIIHDAGAGWQGTVNTTLDELLKDISPSEKAMLAPYVTLAKTIIKEIK